MSVEEDFKKLYDDHIGELDAADKAAGEAISKLEALSEKYGIPYHAAHSPLGQVYRPTSYNVLNAGYRAETDGLSPEDGEYIEDDLMRQVTGDGSGNYEGWQHSSVC